MFRNHIEFPASKHNKMFLQKARALINVIYPIPADEDNSVHEERKKLLAEVNSLEGRLLTFQEKKGLAELIQKLEHQCSISQQSTLTVNTDEKSAAVFNRARTAIPEEDNRTQRESKSLNTEPMGGILSNLNIRSGNLKTGNITYIGSQFIFQQDSLAAEPLPEESSPEVQEILINLEKEGWDLPSDNRCNFTGREKQLTDLYKNLSQNKTTAITQQQVITGLGGIGKTELAIRYLHRYRNEYGVIIWLDAESSLAEKIRGLARTLKIALEDRTKTGLSLGTSLTQRPLAEIMKDVYLRLKDTSKNWLIIFDNADDLESIQPYLPPQKDKYHSSQGNILITSRWRGGWPDNVSAFPLDVFTLDEAKEFIKNKLNSSGRYKSSQVQVIDKQAESLANLLGCLPLALEQAVGYLKNASNIEEYISHFEKHSKSYLGCTPHNTPKVSPMFYRASVLTTWQLSIEKIKENSSSAVEILRYCAYLNADAIPTWIFEKKLGEHMEACEIFRKLNDYSLVQYTVDGRLHIHRLVQEVIRIYHHSPNGLAHWLTQETGESAKGETSIIQELLSLLASLFNYDRDKPEQLEKFLTLMPHAAVLLEHAKKLPIKHENMGHIYLMLAKYYLHERFDADGAIKYLDSARDFLSNEIKQANIDTLLAFAYWIKSDNQKARHYGEKSLKSYQNHGYNGIDLGEAIFSLGCIYVGEGNFKEAKRKYEECEDLLQKLGQVNYPISSAVIYDSLSHIYSSEDFYDAGKAREYQTKKINIYRNISFSAWADEVTDNPFLTKEKALVIIKLGDSYLEQEEYLSAKEKYTTALNYYQRIFKDHISREDLVHYVMVLEKLGKVAILQDDEQAEKWIAENIISILRKQSKTTLIKELLTVFDSWANQYELKKKYEKAIDYYKQTLALIEDYDPDDIKQAQKLNIIGALYATRKEDYTHQAIEYYTKAIQLKEEALYYRNRSNARNRLGEYPAALVDANKAVELNPQDASYYHWRGAIQDKLGNYQEAIKNYTQALQLKEKAPYYCNRGAAKNQLEDYPAALADINKAIELSPQEACYYHWRGDIQDKLGNYPEAIEDYTQALRLKEEALYYRNRGAVKTKLSDYPAALADINKAIELNPQDASYYYWRGDIQYKSGNYPEAIDDYTQALRLKEEALYYCYRGAAKNQLSDYPAALADINKAIELNPQDASYYYWRGDIQYKSGNYPEAIDDYTQALQLKEEALYYCCRGAAKTKLDDYPAALADINKAIELNPQDANYHNWRRNIQYNMAGTASAVSLPPSASDSLVVTRRSGSEKCAQPSSSLFSPVVNPSVVQMNAMQPAPYHTTGASQAAAAPSASANRPTSGEPIGEEEQKISPVKYCCTIF